MLETLKNYSKDLAKNDAVAGFTVGVILIPQAIAYAFLAGIPPIYGLYSSLIPLLIYAFLGTSRHLSIGPVAVTSILLMTGISSLAAPFTNHFVALVLLTGLLVGILQILMGALRMGFLVSVIAQPVISGFISAAAFIIIASQLNAVLGMQIPSGMSTFSAVIYVLKNNSNAHLPTLLISAISLFFLIVMRQIKKSFPTAIVLLVLFVAISYYQNFSAKGIEIIGKIPDGLPSFYWPKMDWITLKQLMPTVFILTVIGYIGSIGIAKSFQMKHRNYTVNPNQELIALGFSKVIGTFFQGNLASGSYSRSAINEDAGAKTQVSTIITAFIILMALLFLTPLLFYLPKAVLASIILVSVFSLIKVKEAKRYFKVRFDDFVIMLVTFIVTLGYSIEVGILVGVLLSFIFLQYRSAKPHIAELVKIPETNYYRNLNRFPNGISNPNYLIIRFDDQLYFGNADYFKESIYRLMEKRSVTPKYIILHATNIHAIDSSGLHTLEDLYRELTEKNIEVLFSGMIGPVRDILTRSGFIETLGAARQFMNINDTIQYIDESNDTVTNDKALTMQFNERKFSLLNWLKKKF
ncbi:SulP family inorganic anion transporter [Aquimarina agarivorans]|uniref:SulP family inorganic anion transporter n=1 Tax=Aquimarina agarivorans TaxID=980584 RepID=UPI000248FB45|nr:sulfate permease [Aquimarina agarivorans]